MAVRIESCTIDAFGPLANLKLEGLDHPVVVLEGKNEAGKTAFFHFLQTMFYGIYPTDASKHPYTPRDGQQLEGALRFGLSDGKTYNISRRLRSRPQGQLQVGDGDSERLRNGTLPVAEHVPQSVYDSVYALQLDDMVQLKGDAWDEIQDRLLGTLSVEHLRSPRAVLGELEEEATDLWRTDNRGKPEAKQLEQRRSELREAAREARERNAEIRRLRDEIAEHTQRIDELTEEQVELKAEQRRAERLLPVRNLLNQIETFEERAGDLSQFEDLPEDPSALLDERAEEISSTNERLATKREEESKLEEALAAFSERDQKVLDYSEEIRKWGRRVERHEKQRADLKTARRKVEDAQRRLKDAASFLSVEWTDDLAESVRGLSLATVREQIKSYERAERRLRDIQARAETVGLQAQARKSLVPWIAVFVLGVAGVALGLLVSLPVAGVPVAAGAIVVVGLLQAIAAWRHNRRLDLQEEHLDLADRKREAERRAEEIRTQLSDLPLPSERLETPDTELHADLKALTRALRNRDEAKASVEEQEAELKQAERELRTLALNCGLSESEADGPVPDVVTALEERLERAQTRREAALEAENTLPSLRSEIKELDDRLSELREERESIGERLKKLGDGDLQAGIEELDERRNAARRAKMSRDRLESEYPDWENDRDEIEEIEQEGGWSYSDEERARIEQRLESIEQELRTEEKERAGKKKDVEHLLEKRTVGDVESELEHVERRLEEVRTKRDRRMLLAGIVRRADREFRRKHQPDVLRRASDFLATITSGRYQRLSLDKDENRLVVYEEDDGFPHPVRPPLSQGTLDQIYLSLRLAIIDHLDADAERLPVFLDEVFVNWDPDRRHAAFDLLGGMAQERQVFFFTCHPHFAREAVDHLEARHLDLTSLRGAPEDTGDEALESTAE